MKRERRAASERARTMTTEERRRVERSALEAATERKNTKAKELRPDSALPSAKDPRAPTHARESQIDPTIGRSITADANMTQAQSRALVGAK